MQTITSKTAKNGAKLWYVDGKRTSRDKAVEACQANGHETLSNLVAGLTSDPAKFEVGKTYAAKKSVLFDSQINMTVLKRTNCYVTFQFDDDEDDIRKRKVTCENGVEKIYLHESNAIGGDYEFSAQDEVTDEVTESAEVDTHIDGYDESAFDALPNFDDEEDDDELIDPPETTAEAENKAAKVKAAEATENVTAEDKQLPEVKPEFKRYDSFKVKAAQFDATYKAVSFGGITNHSRDKPTSRKEVTSMNEFDDMCWELVFKRYHKHRWHIGRDSWDDPYPYYLDEDGEEVEADVGDDDECREVEEQLGLIYADKRDYTGVSESGWYAEDDPRLKDGYNESYSWREVESDYYRDVL